MPSWKRVILSGSNASLNNLFVTFNVTASAVSSSHIDLDKRTDATSPSWKEGRIFYNTEQGALTVYNDEADISLQVGQEFYTRVFNNSGVTILDGTAVRISGSQGDYPLVYPATSINGGHNSTEENHIAGIATHTIEHNSSGYVTTLGNVRGIDTTAFLAGDRLYVSGTNGGLTNVILDPPHEKIFVGTVVRSHANGIIYVQPLEPIHFGDISGVSGSVPKDNEFYVYDATLDMWYPTNSGLVLSGSMSGSFQGDGSGVTNVDHTNLTNIGTNSHAQIDSHLANTSNPHSTSDANLITTDVTINNTSTTKHGFAPKLSGTATQFLNGAGNWVTPSGVANAYISQNFSSVTSSIVTHNFGAYPLVQVVIGSKTFTPNTINHTSENEFVVSFTTPQSGTIIATLGSPQLNNFVTVAGNYTALSSDYYIKATGAGSVITLLTAVGYESKRILIKNGSSGNITIDTTSSQTMDGDLAITLTPLEALEVISNGVNWDII